MTINSNTFLEVLREYPEIVSEVKSILLARTQTGASICDIKGDYRRVTGLQFPICDNFTEFMLSIPWVTCYCKANGTRIFNIMPKPQRVNTGRQFHNGFTKHQ